MALRLLVMQGHIPRPDNSRTTQGRSMKQAIGTVVAAIGLNVFALAAVDAFRVETIEVAAGLWIITRLFTGPLLIIGGVHYLLGELIVLRWTQADLLLLIGLKRSYSFTYSWVLDWEPYSALQSGRFYFDRIYTELPGYHFTTWLSFSRLGSLRFTKQPEMTW